MAHQDNPLQSLDWLLSTDNPHGREAVEHLDQLLGYPPTTEPERPETDPNREDP